MSRSTPIYEPNIIRSHSGVCSRHMSQLCDNQSAHICKRVQYQQKRAGQNETMSCVIIQPYSIKIMLSCHRRLQILYKWFQNSQCKQSIGSQQMALQYIHLSIAQQAQEWPAILAIRCHCHANGPKSHWNWKKYRSSAAVGTIFVLVQPMHLCLGKLVAVVSEGSLNRHVSLKFQTTGLKSPIQAATKEVKARIQFL